MDGIFGTIGTWFAWLSAQWWFWVLLVVLALAIVIGLSILLWGGVIALTRWAFGTWRRGLIAVPVLLGIVVVIVVNFGAILAWINFYWPLTMVPTLIVLAVPLIMIFGLSGGGGSGSSSVSPGSCSVCGARAGGCPHTRSSSGSSGGPRYDMYSDPRNHADLS